MKSKKPSISKLIVSLVIDAIGMLSYTVPVLGEGIDASWAPISAMLVYFLYDNAGIAVINFAEEITTFDFVPTATLAWIYYTYK